MTILRTASQVSNFAGPYKKFERNTYTMGLFTSYVLKNIPVHIKEYKMLVFRKIVRTY